MSLLKMETAAATVLLFQNLTEKLNIEEQLRSTLSILQLEHDEFNVLEKQQQQQQNYVNNATTTFSFVSQLNTSDGEELYEGCLTAKNIDWTLITMVLYAIVCIVGLIGNTLVIYVVLRFSKMQTITNNYILNLAIADESFLIGIPFLLYTMHSGSWKFGEYMCKAYMVSTSITQFTSSIFLLIMSADRYIAVCHPISSQRYRTPIIAKMVAGFAWLTSVLLMLPVILFASTVQNGEYISCNIKWPESYKMESGTTFILYTLLLGFAIPLTFILCFYYLVIRKLHTVGPQHKSKEKRRSHRKVTKLVLTVITVYIFCWLPYWISQVVLINSSPSQCASQLEITTFLLVGCLGYSNSAINPFLYAFLSENFKKSFRKAFTTCSAANQTTGDLQLHLKWGSSRNKGHKKLKANVRNSVTNNTTNLLANVSTYGTGATNTATTMTVADTVSDISASEVIANNKHNQLTIASAEPTETSYVPNNYNENDMCARSTEEAPSFLSTDL